MRVRVATAIAKALEGAGTEFCFGYNGHGNWALLDALVHETSIKTVASRSEDHAVHMADCYWRTRRQPPMAVVTTSVGPGNANITPAVASAFFDSSALLVLAGGGATQWYGRGGIEEYYRYGPEEWPLTLKPVTKQSFSVTRPDTALEMISRAYKTAISGRPGPVVVQLPFDIQHTEIEVRELPDLARWTTVSRPGPDPEAIERAAALISTAQRPLLSVSSGIHNARAWDELATLAERFDIPVETAVPGKGALPEDHRLSLGCVGRAGTGQANQAARECDVLIGIGTRFGDIDTGGWSLHDIPGSTKLVHIDIDEGELARVYPAEVAIVSDARSAITGLVDALGRHRQADRTPWLDRLDELRREWHEQVQPLRVDDSAPMGYARVFSDVSDVVEEQAPQANVLFDTGHSLSFGPPFLRALSRHYIHSGAFHRMGWTVPGAIGAALARPEQPTVVLVGDGSFVMTGSAMLTAAEQGLPIVVIVLNNSTLQIEREQMIKFYGRHSLTDYVDAESGAPHRVDFAAWGRVLGANGVTVRSPDEIKPAVKEALSAGRPTIIDVDIDPESPGYRSIHYRYPSHFDHRGLDNPPF
ncbi:thiamine pyrophosphate-binding protein [Pseudonocardia acaciae]|uniref:thiamine pyrophosphate-binding protein n=1 Tax=Pseudonocardia acaciae TaxID=551276 RepID=UPI00048EAD8D|nr:thiamine pyrophosphate-binding protein [Pseudonocardia acaciae]